MDTHSHALTPAEMEKLSPKGSFEHAVEERITTERSAELGHELCGALDAETRAEEHKKAQVEYLNADIKMANARVTTIKNTLESGIESTRLTVLAQPLLKQEIVEYVRLPTFDLLGSRQLTTDELRVLRLEAMTEATETQPELFETPAAESDEAEEPATPEQLEQARAMGAYFGRCARLENGDARLPLKALKDWPTEPDFWTERGRAFGRTLTRNERAVAVYAYLVDACASEDLASLTAPVIATITASDDATPEPALTLLDKCRAAGKSAGQRAYEENGFVRVKRKAGNGPSDADREALAKELGEKPGVAEWLAYCETYWREAGLPGRPKASKAQGDDADLSAGA